MAVNTGLAIKEQQQRISEIFVREQAKFRGYVRRKAVDLSYMDVEDIVADVFFNLFNKADIFGPVENLTAYIYRSIANKIMDYRRQTRSISLGHGHDEVKADLIDSLPNPTASISNILQQKHLQERLYAAIESLDVKQRAVWVATEIEGRSFRELSLAWGEPLGTLLSRKSRAVKALQVILKDVFDD